VVFRLVGAALLGVTVGCTDVERVASPLAPSESLTLTVRVNERTTEVPIDRASVQHGANTFYTNVFGESAIPVAIDRETTVTVSAPGYVEMSATGLLANDERWTFYLAPVPTP
jgi:hypothetical protein